jgi:hypothetical protein
MGISLASIGKMLGFQTGPSQEEINYGNQAGQYGGQYGIARNALSGIANQNAAQASGLTPQTNASLQDLIAYLSRGTTDSQRGAYVNQQTQGMDQAYQAGQGALAAQLRARGISPDSSVGVGGLALLEGQRAGALGSAQIGARNYFDQRQQQNLGSISDLLYGRQQTAQGNAANLFNQNANSDLNAASMYANLQSQAAQRRQQQNAQRFQLLGSFAGGLGNILGQNQGNASTQTTVGPSAIASGLSGGGGSGGLGGGGFSGLPTNQLLSPLGYLSPGAQSAGRRSGLSFPGPTNADMYGTQ